MHYPFFIIYTFYYSTGIAHCNGIRGYIFRHNAASTDGYVVTNGHTWQDGDATAYPYVVADGDWLCPLFSTVALYRVGAVTGRVDADVRANKAIVTDSDSCFIEYSEVEVRKESLAHADLLTVVAVERLNN